MFSRSLVMNAPRRYNFFELPNRESTRKKPFRADEILLLVVSGSVDTKEAHETNIKQRQGLRLDKCRDKIPPQASVQ